MRRRRYMQGSGEPPAIYNETDAQFYYRQTSGGAIMDNSPLIGRFDKIKGNTIAWNQLVQNGDFSDGITSWKAWGNNGSLSVSNNTLTYTITTLANTAYSNAVTTATGVTTPVSVSGHVFLISYDAYVTKETRLSSFYFGNRYNDVVVQSGWNHIVKINSALTNGDVLYIGLKNAGSYNYQVGDSINIKNVMTIDLTLIYGSGNEPSTVAQFEADYFKWFGKPLTYEAYDEGSLRSVKMSGIKSVGFNQWDEVNWDIGAFLVNGSIITTNGFDKAIHCTEYIKILKGISYFFYCKNQDMSKWYAAEYDENKNFIQRQAFNKGIVYTPSSDATYFKFATENNYGSSTYLNDICINISNTAKNGTYETHWSETRNIPITTLTGKVNGQGESVVVFPDGMLSAGSVHDEIYKQDGKTYAIKRVKRVYLGTLNWTKATAGANTLFYSEFSDGSRADNPHGLCSNYVMANDYTNNKICRLYGSSTYNFSRVGIRDDDLSSLDDTQFKAAMSGVYLNYELAEPIIYELDGFTLPVSYNCAALGTEEILPENTSTPTSVAPIVDTSYRVGHVAEKPWYGIKWSEDNGQMQRIASNMELHATLPIQSKMKRCMLLDNGSVYKYISDADPFLYEDGTSVKYDGTDGQVMVEVPAYWYTAYKETDENNITWNYLKLYPKGGGQMYSRKIYRGAFEMITDNSDNSVAKGCSVSMLDFASMGTTKDTTSFVASAMKYLSAATSYRNWNYGVVDATNVKNSLGKPTTNRNRATFRSIAARRGVGFSQEYWDSYNSLIRLYVVEYCNFDIQATINDTLTVEDFRQGGLGAGVTNADSGKWSNFNGYNSFVPCGVTVPLGNKSGAVSYAFTNNDFHNVNITYSVPSYRGIENPFGHIEKFIDGLNRKGKVDNSVTTEMIYVCDRVSKFAEDNADGYLLESDTAPRASGNFGGVDWNAKGTFWPKLGGRTMYSDYFYNAYANNTWYTLTGGSKADAGSNAGLFSLRAYSASSYANDSVGSRLLYTK